MRKQQSVEQKSVATNRTERRKKYGTKNSRRAARLGRGVAIPRDQQPWRITQANSNSES